MNVPIRQRPVRPQQFQPSSQPGAAGGVPMQPMIETNLRRDFFVYTITFSALAAGTTANGSIQMQNDADFEAQKLTFFADIAAAAQTEDSRVLPLVTLQVTDTGTGRQMFAAAVAIPAIMGDGRIPFILPTTKLFTRNASVAFQVSNFSAATAYNLRLNLIGAKIFKYGN